MYTCRVLFKTEYLRSNGEKRKKDTNKREISYTKMKNGLRWRIRQGGCPPSTPQMVVILSRTVLQQ